MKRPRVVSHALTPNHRGRYGSSGGRSRGTCRLGPAKPEATSFPLFHCRLRVANSPTRAGTATDHGKGRDVLALALASMLARSSCRSVADGGGKLYTYGIRSTELRSMARTIRRQIRPSRKSGDECRYGDLFQEKAGQGGCLPRRILSVLHTWHISACFPASPCAQVPFAIQSPVSGFPRERSPANHSASNCVMLLPLALRHILSRLENSGSCP